MKLKHILFIICTAAAPVSLWAQTDAQDSTGLPGDNFSLEGALEMFKKAGSPEEFERLINTENNQVNNLDLNDDGEIDYIKVIDKKEGDAHAFILQDAVSESESQDVAVIEVEKKGNDNAVLQIIGDEDIYGEQIIVEPKPAEAVQPAPAQATSSSNVTVNVWAWPAVRYVYGPSYVVWASPWAWRARPVWWRPWHPVRRHVFYGYRAVYRPHYVVVPHHRVVYAHRVYRPVRTTSVMVHTRHQASVNHYRATRTTHVVNGPRGGHVKTTRTTVHGKRGGRTRTTRVRTRN